MVGPELVVVEGVANSAALNGRVYSAHLFTLVTDLAKPHIEVERM